MIFESIFVRRVVWGIFLLCFCFFSGLLEFRYSIILQVQHGVSPGVFTCCMNSIVLGAVIAYDVPRSAWPLGEKKSSNKDMIWKRGTRLWEIVLEVLGLL